MDNNITKISEVLSDIQKYHDAKIKTKDITIGILAANLDDRDKKIKTLETIIKRVQIDEVCTQKRADDNLFYFIMSVTISFVLTSYFIYTL